MERARIDDVAREAGVSKTAVSFAFNQPDNLNAATRDRILAVAATLGYRPSPLARRLASRRTGQIGLVVPQEIHDIFANPFMGELLRGLGEPLDQEGLSLVIVPPVQGSLAKALDGALVDGLVLLGLSPDHPELAALRHGKLPLVVLDGDGWDDVPAVSVDDFAGGRAAAEHLRSIGHRRITVVLMAAHADSPVDEGYGTGARRMAGIRAGLGIVDGTHPDDVGIDLRIVAATVSADGGRDLFLRLHRDGLPSAVMLMSDITAIGLLTAATAAGVRVPEDLSIVGYDDIPAASWTTPQLTTVHQPIREKGRRAAEALGQLVAGTGFTGAPHVELPTHLVVRGSTALPATI